MARCGSGGVGYGRSRCRPSTSPRRSPSSAPTSRSRNGGCGRWSPASASAPSASPSQTPAATSPASARGRSATATSTSSTARKTYITNGVRAHVLLLVAKTDPSQRHTGISLFLVDTDNSRLPRHPPGVAGEGRHVAERHRRAAQLRRHAGAGREPARRRGSGLPPDHVGASGRAAGRCGRGCVAGAELTLDQTVAVLAWSREAFGQRYRSTSSRPSTRSPRCRPRSTPPGCSCTRRPGGWKAGGVPGAARSPRSKLLATRIHFEVADTCLQLHGGIGYMMENAGAAGVARLPPRPHRCRRRRGDARRDRALVRAVACRS